MFLTGFTRLTGLMEKKKIARPQLRGLIVIPDLIGNPEKSMLDSRFRGNDSVEVHNLPMF